jgi:hypothetical protein
MDPDSTKRPHPLPSPTNMAVCALERFSASAIAEKLAFTLDAAHQSIRITVR